MKKEITPKIAISAGVVTLVAIVAIGWAMLSRSGSDYRNPGDHPSKAGSFQHAMMMRASASASGTH